MPIKSKYLLGTSSGYIWTCLTRGNHLKPPREKDRPTQAFIPRVSSFVHEELGSQAPREGIVERKASHADLILPPAVESKGRGRMEELRAWEGEKRAELSEGE